MFPVLCSWLGTNVNSKKVRKKGLTKPLGRCILNVCLFIYMLRNGHVDDVRIRYKDDLICLLIDAEGDVVFLARLLSNRTQSLYRVSR